MSDYDDREPEEGDRIETMRRRGTRRARKVYNEGTSREIRPGDLYNYSITAGYEVGGPRWMDVWRSPVAKA